MRDPIPVDSRRQTRHFFPDTHNKITKGMSISNAGAVRVANGLTLPNLHSSSAAHSPSTEGRCPYAIGLDPVSGGTIGE